MPELQTRDQYEMEIVAALSKAWEPFRTGNVDQELLASATREALEWPLYEAGLDAAYGYRAESGGKIGGIPLSKQISEWASGRAATLAAASTANTMRMLRMKPAEEVFSPGRMATLAATEVTGAVTASEGIAIALLLMPRDMVVAKWVTAADERVCELCGPLDGEGRELFGFVAGNGPPAHPNCRCWLEYEIQRGVG